MVTKLEEVDERGGKVLSVMSGLPLVVRGPCGFGRVTLITVDIDQKLFSRLARSRPVLGAGRRPAPPSAPSRGPWACRWAWGGSIAGGSPTWPGQLRAALEQFPGVRLIPFGWVAFFIFLYILLIGPGDYFFLKKVLKRMELTWITFPTIVVTVSLLAYYAAYLFKGNDLLVNQVDVVDVDQTDRPGARHDLGRPVQPAEPRLHDAGAPPAARPRAAAGRRELRRGADPAGGGYRGRDELVQLARGPVRRDGQLQPPVQLRRRRLRLRELLRPGGLDQADGAVESLQGVRIPIWSTKCVTARWFGPAAPLVDSDLQPVGTDRLSGTVTNRLDIPLEDAIVAFGKHVYLLGTIGPRGDDPRRAVQQRPQPLRAT